jgi:hypothetical protein
MNVFTKLLKDHTTIDHDFIDEFFKKFKINGELEFDIPDKKVASYLGVSLDTIRRRLSNNFAKKKLYYENVDYIKIQNIKSHTKTYMINYNCFERLAMNGDTKQAEVVRLYFSKLRQFISENQHLISQAMDNNAELQNYSTKEVIYFFAADETNMNFKVGRTSDIIQRLRNYNVGRINEVDLKYLAIVKNSKMIEKCIKLKLKKNAVIPNREIYNVDVDKLKDVIMDCYCKYVTKEQHVELYDEIGDLAKLYKYTCDKKKIKPYVIIG